jgi:hypothetical protein
MIEAVCDIIAAQHRVDAQAPLEHRIVFDAALIADLEDRIKGGDIEKDRLGPIVDTRMFTAGGKEEAQRVLHT